MTYVFTRIATGTHPLMSTISASVHQDGLFVRLWATIVEELKYLQIL